MARTRKCVATGECLPEAQLLRFVRAPTGEVVFDAGAKLPGRGAWVRADRDALSLAVKRSAFARGFKAPSDAVGLIESVETALVRRCMDLLGLAKRSGEIAQGSDAVSAALRGGGARLWIEAADGSEDGRSKLARLADAALARASGLTAAEMGMALGRDRVVHLCLLHEGMARRVAVDFGRLAGFRTLAPGFWP